MAADTDVEARDAFCMGFFARCVEEGLSKEATEARLAKLGQVKTAIFGLGETIKNVGTLGLAAPVVLGLGAGGLLGYGAAQVTEPDVDADQVRAQEIANTYRLYAQRAAAKRRLRAYRPASSY